MSFLMRPFRGSQDGQARTDQSSTRAYEDQRILADAVISSSTCLVVVVGIVVVVVAAAVVVAIAVGM